MQNFIFYSWQSDSPNNKNRGFIEDCLEKAIKEINNENINLEVAVDRDTKGISGTPDIVRTVFSKIDLASIFIADISFINPNTDFRKCPNPNVLVELGYAAKVLGWEKIICIFNTEFGKVEDLPFDLRFRRPLTYKFDSESKLAVKKKLIGILKNEISIIIEQQDNNRDLKIFLKQQVDKEIISICSHLYKMILGYGPFTESQLYEVVNLTLEELKLKLFEKKIIGFTVIKDWKYYINTFKSILNQPLFAHQADQNLNNAMIQVIKTITTLSVYQKHRNIFYDTKTEVKDLSIVYGKDLNEINPEDRYVLIKKVDEEKGKVVDSGVIQKYNIDKATNYLIINDEFDNYVEAIFNLCKSLQSYIIKTGNTIIIDPLYFRV